MLDRVRKLVDNPPEIQKEAIRSVANRREGTAMAKTRKASTDPDKKKRKVPAKRTPVEITARGVELNVPLPRLDKDLYVLVAQKPVKLVEIHLRPWGIDLRSHVSATNGLARLRT